jgi:hypothetical protein
MLMEFESIISLKDFFTLLFKIQGEKDQILSKINLEEKQIKIIPQIMDNNNKLVLSK